MIDQPPAEVENYILNAPETCRDKLRELRKLLREAAPEASEMLKWGKPVFMTDTILFAYSGHAKHISFIPTGPALEPFLTELSDYVVKKDSVQFPINQPLPVALIKRIASFRVTDVRKNDAKWRY